MAVEVERLLVTLEARIGDYNRNMLAAQAQTNRQLSAIENRFATANRNVTRSASTMAMGVTGALGGIGAALSVAALVEYSNAWVRLSRSVDANSQVFGIALRSAKDLTALANDARVDVEAYAKLYIRTSAAIKDYGYQAGVAEEVTSTLSKALKLGGANASEQASVLLQFSQALQKGKLDGDEFRTVMENAGIVQDLLAKRLNVTKGQIIEMAAAGKLQIKDLVGAMIDGAGKVDSIYRTLPLTIDEAFSVLRNNVILFIGEADKGTQASQKFAGAILTVADNLGVVATVLGAILGASTIRLASFAAAAMGAANPLTLLAAAAGALIVGYANFSDEIKVTDDGFVSLKNSVDAFIDVLGGQVEVDRFNESLKTMGEEARAAAIEKRKAWEAENTASGRAETAVNKAKADVESFTKTVKELDAAWGGVGASILNAIGASIRSDIDGAKKRLSGFFDFAEQVSDRATDLAAADGPGYSGPARRGRPSMRKAKAGATPSTTEKRSQFEREVDQIMRRTAALQAEADVIGQSTVVSETARAAAELRFAAQQTAAKEGRKVTEAELEKVNELAASYGALQGKLEFLASLQAQRDQTQVLKDEIALVGLYGVELEKARITQELLNNAKRAGVVLTPALLDEINAIAGQNAELMRQRDLFREIEASSKDSLKSFITDLREGASAGEALGNQLNKLADKLIDMAVDGLVSAALGPLLNGGTGGGGGALGGAIAGLLGFKDGGVFKNGSGSQPLKRFAKGGISNEAAIFGEAGTEAAVPLPDGRRIPVDLRVGGGGGGGGNMSVTVAPVFNVQNGTPEGVDKLSREVTPQIQKIVRKEVGEMFDRQRRFAKSGV